MIDTYNDNLIKSQINDCFETINHITMNGLADNLKSDPIDNNYDNNIVYCQYCKKKGKRDTFKGKFCSKMCLLTRLSGSQSQKPRKRPFGLNNELNLDKKLDENDENKLVIKKRKKIKDEYSLDEDITIYQPIIRMSGKFVNQILILTKTKIFIVLNKISSKRKCRRFI
jgi:hypothetical protein